MSRRRNLKTVMFQLDEVLARPRHDPNASLEKAFVVLVDGDDVALWLRAASGRYRLHDPLARVLINLPRKPHYRFEDENLAVSGVVEIDQADIALFSSRMIAQRVI